MKYNWQQADWPEFRYETEAIEDLLFSFAEEMGLVTGIVNALTKDVQGSTIIDIMVAEAIKTSEIEGEFLSREDVTSSIKNNLGINKIIEPVKDKRANGIGRLMVAVRDSYMEPLSEAVLFNWHKMLMEGNTSINAGEWRTHQEPMQVVSGAMGFEKVHFEAPPSERVAVEMQRFTDWFNATAPGGVKEIKRAPVRAAVSHIYFESIHPFEDGNGRIGRAIAEKALSQTVGRPVLLSLSRTIEQNKKAYYKALETAQRDNEISNWVAYFVHTIAEAQTQARQTIEFTLMKTKFFDHFKDMLNERQAKVIRRMMEASYTGFTGGMNAQKYMSMTKTSKATATRDLQQLSEIKALVTEGGGRSTRYVINTRFEL